MRSINNTSINLLYVLELFFFFHLFLFFLLSLFLFLFFNHLLSWRSPPLVLPVLIIFFYLLDDGFHIECAIINRNVSIPIKIAFPVWIPSFRSSCFQINARDSQNSVFSNHFSITILLLVSTIIFPRNRLIIICHKCVTNRIFFR
ncbi:hypothetical protein HanIR_Chr12g0582481 [Helianthus annuus]|nr:hypothetical protein HanIR_Chr12g0582481 [Helianthus annuus]